MSKTALCLAIIGSINWLLVGLFHYDLVAALFNGVDSPVSRIIFVIIGLGGLYCIPLLFNGRRVVDD